jgi:hypothetical protein
MAERTNYEFDAEIVKANESGTTAFVRFPYDAKACFGQKNLAKIQCTFDGQPYRGVVADMGAGPVIALLQTIRAKIGKKPGDTVRVVVWKDDEPRIYTPPEDLAAALEANAAAKACFAGLAPSHQKAYVVWVEESKKAETRAARVEKAVAMLAEGKKLK